MTTRNERNSKIAAEVLAKGEANKATIKTGLEAVSRMYDDVRGEFNDATKYAHCWDVAMELHNVRVAKHAGVFGDWWPRVFELVELREAIKAMPVIVREAKMETVEQKIVRTLKEEIERRRDNYDRAKRAVDLLVEFHPSEDTGLMTAFVKRLNTHVVYCQNSFGTSWLRIDWYLDGRKTAFQFIMGAIQEIREESGIK
jgi:hypothetical protein